MPSDTAAATEYILAKLGELVDYIEDHSGLRIQMGCYYIRFVPWDQLGQLKRFWFRRDPSPSGDDVLAGFIPGFRYARRHSANEDDYVRTVCKAILGATANKTNLISKSHLQYASRGTTTESTYVFINSLLGHENDLASCTIEVLTIAS